jgi:hypothetical protein
VDGLIVFLIGASIASVAIAIWVFARVRAHHRGGRRRW